MSVERRIPCYFDWESKFSIFCKTFHKWFHIWSKILDVLGNLSRWKSDFKRFNVFHSPTFVSYCADNKEEGVIVKSSCSGGEYLLVNAVYSGCNNQSQLLLTPCLWVSLISNKKNPDYIMYPQIEGFPQVQNGSKWSNLLLLKVN